MYKITYSKDTMTLGLYWGKHCKFLQCPFGTWWKARKYFKKPKFKFYFGPMWKYKGKVKTEFGEIDDYEYKGGYWPAASTEFLKWYTPKWFPIHVSSWDIGWKDKYNTPRYEHPGHFIIFFGRDYHKHWQFSMVVKTPEVYCVNDCTRTDHEDNYWESILCYLHYADEYNEPKRKRNLYKARQSMNRSHWSATDTINITDFEIKDIGEEHLELGHEHKNDGDFIYVDISSERMGEYIADECSSYNLYKRLHSDCNVSLKVTAKDSELTYKKIKYYHTDYVSVSVGDEDELDETFRLFFNKNDKGNEELYGILRDKNYGQIEICAYVHLDLGPSFKDEFLNKKGVELIRRLNKK